MLECRQPTQIFQPTYHIRNLHDKCNPSSKNTYLECAETWPCKPLFHYSESHPDKTNPCSHADMPTGHPASDAYDWDIELKSKDSAIRACAAFQATAEILPQKYATELSEALTRPFKSFMESDIKDYFPRQGVDK